MAGELVIDLVRQYSPSRQERGAVETLVGWMAERGFETWIDEAGNACGQRGPADADHTLIMLGHIDTYPGEIPVKVEDDVLTGRGSVDAKGSLAAFAESAAQASIPAGWRVLVVGAVEEEIATSKGAHFIRDQYTPDLGIIGEPSSSARVTLGYKGRLLVDLMLKREVAHTARPEPSVGALGAELWVRITTWAAEMNQGVDKYFDQVMTNLNSINTENDHFHDTLRMTIGFRLPPRCTPDEVFAVVRGFAPEDAELRAYSCEQAYQGDKNNALVRGFLSAIRAEGHQPGFVLKTGTSDMNVVGSVWTCPMVAYGPGDSSLDHTPNEHLPLGEYRQAVAVLKRVIEELR
jgi:[amino group carrier protein]-lysine/ornithine hydrolase